MAVHRGLLHAQQQWSVPDRVLDPRSALGESRDPPGPLPMPRPEVLDGESLSPAEEEGKADPWEESGAAEAW